MEPLSVKIGAYDIPAFRYPVGESSVSIIQSGGNEGASLLNRFSQCRAAHEFLVRIARTVNITLWYSNEPFEISRTAYTNAGPVVFLFPSEDPMGTLGFELYNAAQGFDNTLAKQGNQDIDEYATTKAMEEFGADVQRYALRQECFKSWKSEIIPVSKPSSPELFAFMREWDCTSDAYRAEWRAKYKEAFCPKHPDDSECSKPRVLCDRINAFHFNNERDECTFKWIAERFCSLFSKTSPALRSELRKEFPEMIETHCLNSYH